MTATESRRAGAQHAIAACCSTRGAHREDKIGGRWFSAGLLSQSFYSDEGAHEELAFSGSVSLRGTYYFSEGAKGYSIGLGIERLSTRVEDTKVDREAYLTSVWIPLIQGGYRFSFDQFYISPGAAVGIALVTDTETEDLSNGMDPVLRPVNAPDGTPFATIDLEVGVSF